MNDYKKILKYNFSKEDKSKTFYFMLNSLLYYNDIDENDEQILNYSVKKAKNSFEKLDKSLIEKEEYYELDIRSSSKNILRFYKLEDNENKINMMYSINEKENGECLVIGFVKLINTENYLKIDNYTSYINNFMNEGTNSNYIFDKYSLYLKENELKEEEMNILENEFARKKKEQVEDDLGKKTYKETMKKLLKQSNYHLINLYKKKY